MKKNLIPSLGEITRCVRLENGLEAYILPLRSAPVVSVQAYVRTGSIHEEEFLGCGLSHFLEHMLFMGSSRYPGNAASDKVSALGGYFNACTGRDYTSYIVFLPSRHFGEALDILDDMLRNPLFPEEKFQSEKNVILRESAMYDDSPESRLDDLLSHLLFPTHPAGIPIIGYREKIESVTRETMCAYYRKRYSPHRCFYVITGDVDVEKTEALFREKCSSWAMGDLREPFLPPEPPNAARRELVSAFADPQTYLGISWHTPDANDPDYPAVKAFFNLLVQSDNSRLDRKLVMEKELAFDVSGSMESNTSFASAGIFASCEYGKRERLSRELFKTAAEFIRVGPTEKELQGAVTRVRAQHCRAFLTVKNLASAAGGALLYTGSVKSMDAFMARFQSLTPDEVRAAGEKYFREENSSEVFLVPQGKEERKRSVSRRKDTSSSHPVSFRTGNGYRIVFLEEKGSSFVHLSLFLPCGIYCGKGGSAAGPLLADLLPTGTKKYTEEEICALLSDNAVSLDIRAGSASLRFTLSALREKWDIAVEILRSLLQEALFDKKKLERERLSLLEEYRSNLANPEYYAFDVFCSEMAGERYSPSPESHLKSMETLSAGELKKIFETVCLSPEKAVLGLSGALTEKEAAKSAETLLGSLKAPGRPLPVLPPKSYEKGVRRLQLELDKNQSMFLLGFPGCTASSRDRFALGILKEAAGSMSSRLFDVVRNQNGLAYYTGIKLISSPAFGELIYYAGTEKKSLKKLECLFEEEIRRVREKGLTPQEIEEAKKWIVFREAVRRQEPGALVHEMARNEFFGGSFHEALRMVDLIEGLSVKEINSVIAKYLSSPTSLVLSVVPPEKGKSGKKRGSSPGK